MKAAVFYGKHNLKIENIEIPTPESNEVQIKVEICGICGTDVHIFEGDEGAAPTPLGTVLGHEFSGIVAKTGEGVKNINVGDRVCVDPNKLCGDCYYCKSGIGHFCENMVGIGTTVNGGFAEYCNVPKSQIYKIPDNVSFEAAAMTEPVACCLHGIDMCDISAGDTVLIIGGGMIGLIMLQLAKLKGASRLILSEPDECKRELAKKLGADVCINPLETDLAKELKVNGIDRVNTVIECVGNPKTMEQAISVAGQKSMVMFFGLTNPDAVISIKPFELFKKEIVLKASYINPYTQQRALDLISSGKIDVSSMICSVLSLYKLPRVLTDKNMRSKGKALIKC